MAKMLHTMKLFAMVSVLAGVLAACTSSSSRDFLSDIHPDDVHSSIDAGSD